MLLGKNGLLASAVYKISCVIRGKGLSNIAMSKVKKSSKLLDEINNPYENLQCLPNTKKCPLQKWLLWSDTDKVQPNKLMLFLINNKVKVCTQLHGTEKGVVYLQNMLVVGRFSQITTYSCSLLLHFSLATFQIKSNTMTMFCFVDALTAVPLHCRWLLHNKSHPMVCQLNVFMWSRENCSVCRM